MIFLVIRLQLILKYIQNNSDATVSHKIIINGSAPVSFINIVDNDMMLPMAQYSDNSILSTFRR